MSNKSTCRSQQSTGQQVEQAQNRPTSLAQSELVLLENMVDELLSHSPCPHKLQSCCQQLGLRQSDDLTEQMSVVLEKIEFLKNRKQNRTLNRSL